MEALSLGASDFVQKPSGSVSEDIYVVKETLVGMLLGYGGAYRKTKGKKVLTPSEYKPKTPNEKQSDIAVHFKLAAAPPVTAAQPPQRVRSPAKTEIIAIGISTGGPDALRVVFSKLDADLKVPILVVQHMPAGFTNEFARALTVFVRWM